MFDLFVNDLTGNFSIRFLNKYFNGNLKIALMAYNAGITGYKKANNYWYYEKVMKQKNRFSDRISVLKKAGLRPARKALLGVVSTNAWWRNWFDSKKAIRLLKKGLFFI